MAENGNTMVNVTQPTVPMFKGENYEFWSIKMSTLFKSHGLWDLIDKGVPNPDPNPQETTKRDARALFFIQQAVHDTIFSKIAAATSAKEAWTTLKTAFQGSSRVMAIKLQGLRRDFETLQMQTGESVQIFLSRVTTVVNQIRAFGDTMAEKTVVAKVLRSLTPKFDHVVAAIEESKDLDTYTFDELMGSLQTHEARLSKSEDKGDEKAFYTQGETSRGRGRRGRGRGNFGRGRGRGRSNTTENTPAYDEFKKDIQCYYCNKFGHYQYECYKKQRDETQAHYAEEDAEEEDAQPTLFMASSASDKVDASSIWFLDSGCSNHMTGYKQLFEELDETYKLKVRLGDDKMIQVEGKGKVAVHTKNGMRYLHNVYFIPDLTQNLLSIGQLMDSGYSIVFERKTCVIKSKNQVLVEVNMAINKLFPLKVSNVEERAMAAKVLNQSELWHLRYGHLNINGLKLLNQKEMVYGLPEINQVGVCEGCILGKQAKFSFPKGQAMRATQVLELVHADLCGPMQTESLGGSKYFLLFTDDYSRMSWVYFLQSKGEVFSSFKVFKSLVEKQSEKKLKVLRTDRGGEFLSKEFINFCEIEGIHHELTTPYTPEQNGVAERKNRTVVEMGRSMLKCKKLPNKFWAEAVATAVYILNISPTKAVMNKTPFEAWFERKPGVSHLRVFGSIAYALINPQKRTKLDNKFEKCIFIGYCTQSKGYRLYNPENGQIVVSRNVLFDEEASWQWESVAQQTQVEETIEENEETVAQDQTHNQHTSSSSSGTADDAVPEMQPRKFKTVQELYETTQVLLVADPTTYEEASEKQEWRNAMQEEIQSIEKNRTWHLVKLPEGKNVIGLKWIFKTKFGADGSVQKFKARLVAKGYA